MRDLQKDLEICEAATPGPWVWECVFDGEIQQGLSSKATGARILWNYAESFGDSDFIAAAREGWPEAIIRAIKAEEQLARKGNLLNDYKAAKDKLEEENATYRTVLNDIYGKEEAKKVLAVLEGVE